MTWPTHPLHQILCSRQGGSQTSFPFILASFFLLVCLHFWSLFDNRLFSCDLILSTIVKKLSKVSISAAQPSGSEVTPKVGKIFWICPHFPEFKLVFNFFFLFLFFTFPTLTFLFIFFLCLQDIRLHIMLTFLDVERSYVQSLDTMVKVSVLKSKLW